MHLITSSSNAWPVMVPCLLDGKAVWLQAKGGSPIAQSRSILSWLSEDTSGHEPQAMCRFYLELEDRQAQGQKSGQEGGWEVCMWYKDHPDLEWKLHDCKLTQTAMLPVYASLICIETPSLPANSCE